MLRKWNAKTIKKGV